MGKEHILIAVALMPNLIFCGGYGQIDVKTQAWFHWANMGKASDGWRLFQCTVRTDHSPLTKISSQVCLAAALQTSAAEQAHGFIIPATYAQI